MDAKRLIAVLKVRKDGRLAEEPEGPAASGPVHPAEWAGRMEYQGADGVLFEEAGETGVQGDRARWLREVAEGVGIPFALAAPYGTLAELEAALGAGAEQVVLLPEARPLLEPAARELDRSRLGASLTVRATENGHWVLDQALGEDAAQGLAAAELWNAGELLLDAPSSAPELPAWLQALAAHGMTVLYRGATDAAAGVEALLSGADGLLVPAGTPTPQWWKSALAARGLLVRP